MNTKKETQTTNEIINIIKGKLYYYVLIYYNTYSFNTNKPFLLSIEYRYQEEYIKQTNRIRNESGEVRRQWHLIIHQMPLMAVLIKQERLGQRRIFDQLEVCLYLQKNGQVNVISL